MENSKMKYLIISLSLFGCAPKEKEPFHVGQKVVAVRDSRMQGYFHEGRGKVIQAVEFKHCSWAVDIGDRSLALDSQMCECTAKTYYTDTIWASASAFKN